jgi:two-component system, chemotaxis family, sensor histidine kinase and response regulator PixL
MIQDSEQQVRLQFLDEAQEYLNEIEAGVLGMSTHGIERSVMDGVLRAAHSIKGGSAMMGYSTLSQLAHQMEDFFKVLKLRSSEAKESEVERLMLVGVDHLRQIANDTRQGTALSAQWLTETVQVTFDSLHDYLGEPQDDDAAALLSEEVGADMVVLLFETEVDAILNRLDEVLENPDLPCLQEEFAIAAQELSGLGEMLDLPTFRDLCQDIATQVTAADITQLIPKATLAQEAWRHAQSLVIIGQRDLIPSALEAEAESTLTLSTPTVLESVPAFTLPEPDPMEIWETFDLEGLDKMTLGIEALQAQRLEPQPPEVQILEVQSPETRTLEDPMEIWETFDLEGLDKMTLGIETLQAPTLDVEAPIPVLENVITTKPSTDILNEISEAVSAFLEPETESQAKIQVTNKVSQTAVKTKIVNDPHTMPAEEVAEAEMVLRVPAHQLNQMGELFGELIIERNGIALQLKRLRELTGLLAQRVHALESSNVSLRNTYDTVATQTAIKTQSLEQSSSALAPDSNSSPNAIQGWLSDQAKDFDLLEMDRYSELHTLSQALMESAVQIEEVTTDININLEEAEQTTRAFTRTTKQLQVSMTQMRMRPVSDVLNRFTRMLRDLSLEHGKAVELKIIGGTTLIDRVILETLTDPLVHLLRNAFDHGIEAPQVRVGQGKPAKGLIEISVAYRGNQTLITIRDDGGGISLDIVKAKAAKLGIDSTLLDTASPSEILDLIFEPGFSTASQVTRLSGRGVGMDIVRQSLQKVKGSISVDTEVGRGTTFTLAVPFSLSVIRVLLVESGNLLMAVPIDQVEEMLLLDPAKVSQDNGKRVFQLEDTLIPLVQLKDWFSFSRPIVQSDLDGTPKINQPMLLLVEQNDEVVGIQVDRYWGEQEVTIRQIEGIISLPSAFVGCTILGDGSIAPLLDPLTLLQQIESQTIERERLGREAIAATPNTMTPQSSTVQQTFPIPVEPSEISSSISPLVMVVDDSVNVRRFLALTLEKAGFRVEQAKDGQQALEIVQSGLSIQAVVCDIEMPRLDGYGFLANVKSIPSAGTLPVVMLTSRSGEKHRKLAYSLGAKGYFSKPFREYDLLQTLNRLIAQSSVPALSTR